MLYKDPRSTSTGCPTVYLAESGDLVVQGDQLDAGTLAQLENVLPGETAVVIPAEVLLGAIECYQARCAQEYVTRR